MSSTTQNKTTRPAQHQDRQPGLESVMQPRPDAQGMYKPAYKLGGLAAIITGGDSGIGRAVALAYAMEGANVAILYLNEDEDAEETCHRLRELGSSCVAIAGDVGDPAFCRRAVERTIDEFGRLDILVNNAAEQHVQEHVEDITPEQLERTFRTNIFGYIYMIQAAVPHLTRGSAIINTTSVTAYRGSEHLIDYAATKGAIVSLTRSLGKALTGKGIRVNGVAPGPVWTPLIPASFPAEKVAEFGGDSPMGRPAEPAEMAPSYVFLACNADSSYMTGQILHPNGGEIIGG